jgi:bis(5'-nucleosyl)-tetraphosphatase (symmetrical)
MATYAIGDVQGCYQELMQLIALIKFNPQKDKLWFTGDLVNRGPQSLEVVRYIKNLEDKAVTVLGNHDLHYLAVASGTEDVKSTDTFQDILNAKDADALFNWLRHRPLIYQENEFLLVHAGIAPEWGLNTALACAKEVENILRGPDYTDFLKHLYGDLPNHWDPDLKNHDRIRVIINYCTRMRYIDAQGNLELKDKGSRARGQKGEHLPWFKLPSRLSPDIRIIFGHWAALGGKTDTPHRYALDTGCCWGNALTALRLEDLCYFNVKCDYSGIDINGVNDE